MKYSIICCLIFCFAKKHYSQNLVPNSSFEIFTACPNASGKVEYAFPWTAATTNSSSDYYNSCSSSYNVPNTPTAFQNANTGNAFVGFFFSGASSSNLDSREYLQVQLTSPLIQSTVYYVEFYVNLHDASFASACNNIAANFSITKPFTTNLGDLQTLTPHIMNPGNPIINDRINWIKVSGCYTAMGGEEYLTIGNFFNNANTQFTGTTASSYYFVDDVRVEAITGVCVTGVDELSNYYQIQVYPNPNNGSFTIDLKPKSQIIITNTLGETILKQSLEIGKQNLSIQSQADGIYFVKVTDDKGLSSTKKIVVQK